MKKRLVYEVLEQDCISKQTEIIFSSFSKEKRDAYYEEWYRECEDGTLSGRILKEHPDKKGFNFIFYVREEGYRLEKYEYEITKDVVEMDLESFFRVVICSIANFAEKFMVKRQR